jgi:hypothetical protein
MSSKNPLKDLMSKKEAKKVIRTAKKNSIVKNLKVAK